MYCENRWSQLKSSTGSHGSLRAGEGKFGKGHVQGAILTIVFVDFNGGDGGGLSRKSIRLVATASRGRLGTKGGLQVVRRVAVFLRRPTLRQRSLRHGRIGGSASATQKLARFDHATEIRWMMDHAHGSALGLSYAETIQGSLEKTKSKDCTHENSTAQKILQGQTYRSFTTVLTSKSSSTMVTTCFTSLMGLLCRIMLNLFKIVATQNLSKLSAASSKRSC